MNYFQQESERLRFRKLTTTDSESWSEFFDNNNRLHFLGLDPTKSTSELLTHWMNKQFEYYEDKSHQLGTLAAIHKQSGELIGQCGIIPRIIAGKAELEIAYSLKSKFWKQGYGTEMAQQMRQFGTTHQLAKRFISIIHKDNHDSMHVAEKNGMSVLFESEFLGMEVFVFGVEV